MTQNYQILAWTSRLKVCSKTINLIILNSSQENMLMEFIAGDVVYFQ